MRAIALALVGLLLAAPGTVSSAKAEPIVYKEAGFVFPSMIGLSASTKVFTYKDPSQGMAVQYKNGLKPIITTIYLYPKRREEALPNIGDEFKKVAGAMLAGLEKNGHETEALDPTEEKLGSMTFHRQLVVVDKSRTDYVYLSSYNDYYLKVRATKLEDEHLTNAVRVDATVLGFVKHIESGAAKP